MKELTKEEAFFIRRTKYGDRFTLSLSDGRFEIVGSRFNKTVELRTVIDVLNVNFGVFSRKICDLEWVLNRHLLIENAEAEYLLRNLQKITRLTTTNYNEV